MTHKTHTAPLGENRDTPASSKAYAHLSSTPTQKYKAQNRPHTHTIVITTAEYSLLPGGAEGLQPLSTQTNLKTLQDLHLLLFCHTEAMLGQKSGIFAWSGMSILSLTVIGGERDRDNSGQRIYNMCFILEAYGDKEVLPFYMTSLNSH